MREKKSQIYRKLNLVVFKLFNGFVISSYIWYLFLGNDDAVILLTKSKL